MVFSVHLNSRIVKNAEGEMRHTSYFSFLKVPQFLYFMKRFKTSVSRPNVSLLVCVKYLMRSKSGANLERNRKMWNLNKSFNACIYAGLFQPIFG